MKSPSERAERFDADRKDGLLDGWGRVVPQRYIDEAKKPAEPFCQFIDAITNKTS